jgi:hypothetical protein
MSIIYKLEELKAENVVTAVMFYIGMHVAEEPAAKRGTGASRPTVFYFADQRAGNVVKIPARLRTDGRKSASGCFHQGCLFQSARIAWLCPRPAVLAFVCHV